ncbi:MAG: hypothetical protein AAB428_02380 [Patescibacteria group bacterium]
MLRPNSKPLLKLTNALLRLTIVNLCALAVQLVITIILLLAIVLYVAKHLLSTIGLS